MTNRRQYFASLFAALALAAASLVVPVGRASGETYVLAAHPGLTSTTLLRDDAKRILTGRSTHWPDGTPIAIVLPPRGSNAMRWLTSDVLQIPESVYRRFLLGQVFRGGARAPLQAESLTDALRTTRATQGAITVLPLSATSTLTVMNLR